MTSENDHLAIQVDAEEWLTQVKNELTTLKNTLATESKRWKKQSVYRIPSSVKDLSSNSNAFMPHMVSIGPYHYGEEHLQAMEAHKHRALLHFLSRSESPLDLYRDALAKVVDDLKCAYDQLDDKWKCTEVFIRLMILDGCFILELLRSTATTTTTTSGTNAGTTEKRSTGSGSKVGKDSKKSGDLDERGSTSSARNVGKESKTTTGEASKQEVGGYEENDPVFSKHGRLYIVPYLKRDMLKLENQLPLLVLTTLLAVEKGMPTAQQSVENEVKKLIVKFFSKDYHTKNMNQLGDCFHILDVYRKCLLTWNINPDETNTLPLEQSKSGGGDGQCLPLLWRRRQKKPQPRSEDIIRSATELYEAGIKMKPSGTKSLRDISFDRGVLNLPLVVVDDTSESEYLNLMAFERFHAGAGNEVASYVFFMDRIIDSARDVSLLHTSGIIQNALGSDKAVAELFNSLSKDIVLDPDNRLEVVHKEVSAYCRRLWPRWMASLNHVYFTNPWAGISVAAAIFLFALAGIQTYYSVIGYYNK